MILTDDDLTFTEKWNAIDDIKRSLAKKNIPNDILISSKKEFHSLESQLGSFAHTVTQEGILL